MDPLLQHEKCRKFGGGLKPKLQNYRIQTPKSNMISRPQIEKNKIQTQMRPHSFQFLTCTNRTQIQNPKFKTPDSGIQTPKTKIPNSKPQSLRSRIQNQNPKIQDPESKIKTPNFKPQTPKSKLPNPNPKIQIKKRRSVSAQHVSAQQVCLPARLPNSFVPKGSNI